MSISIRLPRRLLRRILGAMWLIAWCSILYAVAAPWRQLGGLESERLRWLEWWALWGGLSLGYTIGRVVRDWARSGIGRTYAAALRVAFYPPAFLTALALVGLAVRGERGPIGVAATAFLAYWAGLDVVLAAVPLMEGKPYSLVRPFDRLDDEEDDLVFDGAGGRASRDRN